METVIGDMETVTITMGLHYDGFSYFNSALMCDERVPEMPKNTWGGLRVFYVSIEHTAVLNGAMPDIPREDQTLTILGIQS